MNIISTILFVIGVVILIFSLSLKMSNFLDVRKVFLDHFSVFKGNTLQLISIFIVPFLFSVGIVRIRCVDREILNNLNIVLSILIAMFFSTLSILCAFEDKNNKNLTYRQLLKEIFCKNPQNLVKQRITPHFLTTDHPNYYEFTTKE